MEEKLTKEEVLHVAYLARVGLTNEDVEKYQVQLKKLLNEIDKIKVIKNFDEDILITPIDYQATLRDDTEKDTLNTKETMKNVPRSNGNFVEVPVMINE